MYHKEKQILVSLITSILTIGIYSLYVYYNKIAGNPDIINDLKFWGGAFVFLIPIAIIAQIIIHIIMAIINKIITNEDIQSGSDERDRLIELKGTKISHGIFTFGFTLSMGSLAVGLPPYIMFVTIFITGFIACCAEEIAKICFYRKGF
jgi:hypothetical protein